MTTYGNLSAILRWFSRDDPLGIGKLIVVMTIVAATAPSGEQRAKLESKPTLPTFEPGAFYGQVSSVCASISNVA